METLKGYIDHFIFRNDDNGYAVAEVIVGEQSRTCVGNMRGFSEGESVEMEGEFAVHPKYLEEQFKISFIRAVPPEDTLAVVRYLGSGAIKGIRAALAQKIVDKFGKDTLRIMEEEPERLAEVKGISDRMAQEIADQMVGKRDMREAVLFLQQYGISQNLADKIFQKYNSDLYRIIKENPYQMVEDIQGVGFVIADEIASRAGIRVDSDYRIRCGIIYELQRLTQEGHCYYPKDKLIEKTSELLQLAPDHVEIQLMDLVMDKRIFLKRRNDGERVYPASYYREEEICAAKLLELRDSYDFTVGISDQVIGSYLKSIEESMETELDELQKKAVSECIKSGVFILSGGPGTGKTTTINAIIKYLELEHLDFVLAAPTGRAAKRMTETTGYEACTIHRLLEIGGDPIGENHGASFKRNEENPLEVDAVIIDEVSMVDIHLLKALLNAVIPGTKLILVGDVKQLPSVGPGQVLKDIMESGGFCCITLEKIFRQALESHIISYAHKIDKGEQIDFSERYRDFFLLNIGNPEVIYYWMEQLIKERVPKEFHITAGEVQVLTPMRKGPLGAEILNKVLQERLNPPSREKQEYRYGDIIFRKGDKVMQIKNDYNLEWDVIGASGIVVEHGEGVFNGDIGIVQDVIEYTRILKVRFDDGRVVEYPFQILDELEHAYAITIHKSQGSEYPAVIMPILSGPKMLFNRNLLYTGVTRAKDCVMILGSPVKVQEMIATDSVQKRYTSLNERIVELDRV